MKKKTIKNRNKVHQEFENKIEKDFNLLGHDSKKLPAFKQGVYHTKQALLNSFCHVYGEDVGLKLFEFFLRMAIEND